VYPLLRTRQRVLHPEAESLVRRAHYHPFLSPSILASNWRVLRRRPRAYLGALAEVLRGTWGSANFFIGALGIFAKVVRFSEEMVEEGVTHVHAHFANHPALAALIVHRLTGIPFSFTAHGHDLHVDRTMLADKIKAAAFAVMISEYNRNLVLGECPGVPLEKLPIIHCGADTGCFSPGDRPPRKEPGGGPFTLVCVGSFIEVKGHRHLIEACRLLKSRKMPLRCHLVGDGPGRRQLEGQITEAGLGEEVTLHGALPRPRVARLMAEADVIVQPSVPVRRGSREGIPVSLMEGMASGLPAVASRISGIPELVEDGRTGLLVPPGDSPALADALERLAVDPELCRAMGQAGRRKVLEHFDLSRNAARLAGLIAAVGPHPASPRAAVTEEV
jgi:glycosyltransferase involved in cell wall biosynthesis